MMWWGPGWWWIGALFMVVCMVAMGRMMRHGGHHGGRLMGRSDHEGMRVGSERILADRLARGEIDIDEYGRLLEALRPVDGAATPDGTARRGGLG